MILAFCEPGLAAEFTIGDTEIKGTFDNTITFGAGIRTQRRDPTYLGRNFASDGSSKLGRGADASDDGNLNFGPGDVFSSPLKLFSSLTLQKDDIKLVVSGRAWTDFTLENKRVRQGSVANGYRTGETLSDATFSSMARFSNVVLWEGYAEGKVPVGQDATLTGRIGRQTVEFSNRIFFGLLDRINPLDQNSIVRPGNLPRQEISLPVNMLYARYEAKSGLELEGFYQLEYRRTQLSGCGTFVSTVNFADDPSCGAIPASIFFPTNSQVLPASAAVWLNGRFSLESGNFLPILPDDLPKTRGQGGVAIRYAATPALKLGAYFTNMAAHTARLSAPYWDPAQLQTPDPALVAAGAPDSYARLSNALKTFQPIFTYPEDIRTFGLQLAYAPDKQWKVAVEGTYNDNYPVQIATTDFFTAFAGGRGPILRRIEGLKPGDLLVGYDRYARYNLTGSVTRTLPAILGAARGVLIGELGFSRLPHLRPISDTRYNRPYDYGFSPEGYGGGCAALIDPLAGNPDGCVNDGYVTRNAWGYRLRGSLTYALGKQTTLTPTISFLHDVHGYSADRSLVEDRKLVILSLEATHGEHLFGGATYTNIADDARYNNEGDRDNALVYIGWKI